jgi:amidophosphoribosyltransferase
MSLDSPREECGVFAVAAPTRDVARLTYFALHSMQHRGQESAGMAVGDGGVTVVRELGLVTSVFDEPSLTSLTGERAIGHVRYSTTGANKWDNAQPVTSQRMGGFVALGHNGNLTNSDELRAALADGQMPLEAGTDSELIAAALSDAPGTLAQAAEQTMRRIVGAYSVVALDEESIIAFRDPSGVRPLSLGRLGDDGWCIASETCAFEQIGASFERDVEPGEIVVLRPDGVESIQAVPSEGTKLCVFEQIYFARPDSVMDGGTVWQRRRRMGEQLAAESPADADLVVGLPDSGTPAAIGFAGAAGIAYSEAVVRNRYVGRSFIQPDQSLRRQGVRLKFSPLEGVISGKRLVVVDDSIVRGTTMGQVVEMLKDAGATEVHLRVSSPPVLWPCFYGIDMADREQLIAANHDVEEIAEITGATSLAYLSLDGLQSAIGTPASGYCRACLTGEYPIALPESADKLRFEADACGSVGA